ncbi:hypothetical protein HK101_004260 [Irineochytrium annulatum]|nr:hypothetical protein HK101_004260 [Irineochytrium annulatum]
MFKKRKGAPATARKRERSDDEDDLASNVIRKKKDDKEGPLNARTSKPKGKSANDNAEADGQPAEEASSGRGHLAYASSGTAASLAMDMATRTLDVDGEAPREDGEEGKILNGDEAEGVDVYKGMSGYKEYVNKKVEKTTQANANKIRAGPLRATSNVRISCRFDYQMDVCKDYKETGYCGYGDSCVFMHDRGDYKSGWQLEKEWEDEMKEKKKAEQEAAFLGESVEEAADEEDDLPFTCPICQGEFKDPIVTRCGHNFCESCAIRHHAKSQKCFVCGVLTGGVFNAARDLKAKLKEKRAQMAEREAAVKAKVAEMHGAQEVEREEVEEQEEEV